MCISVVFSVGDYKQNCHEILMYKSIYGYMFLFILSKHIGVEWQYYLVGVHFTS